MTYGLAATISCLLLPLFGWLGMALTKRTIYRPISSEEGAQRDEEAERNKVKEIRIQGVTRVFKTYGVIVLVLFALAWLSEPAKKVQAALWPTLTPTQTLTPTPTATRPPTNTPTPSRTPTIGADGSGAGNFLTSIAGSGTGTPFATSTPFLPSGSGGSVPVIRTVIVRQTQIVQVPVTVIVQYPVTVIVVVTATNTPLPTLTPDSPTQTLTPSPTFTPSATPTFTETPTETPTP